jgi:chromosomal replication initiation ATPase DnaA
MSGTGRPRQIPLALAHEPALGRDDLVVTPANAEAISMIDRWPDWPSAVVVLAGPAGSGKSHLASIWREWSQASSVRPAELGRATNASRTGPVLVDGIGVGPFDEAALFHLINTVRASGTHLLLTSRRFPLAWDAHLPDLVSRLRAATTVEVHEPDDALLEGVIAKLFADRQVEVEPHVVSYLARRIERSVATAIDVVDRLDRAALEEKSRITRSLAARIVSALDEGQGALPFP